jgi:glycosyltransferase involved in cell wall biosynthesis
MFSRMLSYGGGRETWISNFLPNLINMNIFEIINVYYISDSISVNQSKLSIIENKKINFIQIKLPTPQGKFTSFIRIFIYCRFVLSHVRKNPPKEHFVIAVGTFYEAIVIGILKLIMRHPPILVTWIRGILSKEINHRHGIFYKKIICILEKYCINLSDYVISNGQDTKYFYEKLLGRHVEAIPNALNILKFREIPDTACKKEKKIISYIGRLSEEKGIRSYLDAIKVYSDSYKYSSNLLFEIVGDGPLLSTVTNFITDNPNIAIRYIGTISNENILEYLVKIDAGVNLTYSKQSGGGGVSNGLLEFIGAKRLVIAWDSPIFKQVLNDTQALFVEEGNVDSLAKSFEFFDSNPLKMQDLIVSSKQILNEYSFDSHVKHFIDYVQS